MVTHYDNEVRPLAVITGASSGIGYSLAKIFAMNGYDLIVCSEERDIHEAANAFRALGGEVESVQCDLASYEGVEKFYGVFKRPVDVLVLNAGVGVGGYFHETDLQKEINLINLNITSLEVKEKGITITALQPGATDTEFFARAGMLDTKAGKSKKDDPDQVAQDGFEALMAGKDHVVAGSFMNAVQATLGKIVPEKVGAKLQGSSTKPGSGH